MLPVLVVLQLWVPSATLPALHVPTELDGKLPCAANQALRSAVALRLPSLRLSAARPEPDDLLVSLSRVGTAWWLEVKRPSGAVAMSRALFVEPDCAQVADTAALILERYLSDIDWRGRPVEIRPGLLDPVSQTSRPGLGNPVSAPVGAPSPGSRPSAVTGSPKLPSPAAPKRAEAEPHASDVGTSSLGTTGSSGTTLAPSGSGLESEKVALGTVKVDSAEPPKEVTAPLPAQAHAPPPTAAAATGPALAPTAFSRWSVSAGGGGWYGFPAEWAGSFSLEVAVFLLQRVRLSVLLTAGTMSERSLGNRGTLRVQTFLGLLTATLCTGQRFSFCGGLAGGARLTTGNVGSIPPLGQRIYRPAGQLLPLPVLGLYGRLAFALFGSLELSADIATMAPLGAGSFAIEGFTTSAYITPPVELIAGLRLGWKFY